MNWLNLPRVFDLETGESYQDINIFELSEQQGRHVAPSFEGNKKVNSNGPLLIRKAGKLEE